MTTRIAIVAHDARKEFAVAWARQHSEKLSDLKLYATGTTGERLQSEAGLNICRLLSGPMGGDAQLGGMIAEGKLDALIFFIDPLSALPHDVDVKSLLRLAILYDTPLAVNQSSANAIIETLPGIEEPT
ncbi:methylglyoxal synthase [Brucella pseudogrignonensis]|uniref:methylglyoxal synthase n=1 Tax=Brucella pseudogrignonensis TaxID=419475 RepID=UPI00286C090C|nr:methylglyoxal synthase [Brucella pseudogrignonensis]